MSYVIESKAGLIGYLQGSMKAVLNNLKATPEREQTWEVKSAIKTLENTLRESEEIWVRVKGN